MLREMRAVYGVGLQDLVLEKSTCPTLRGEAISNLWVQLPLGGMGDHGHREDILRHRERGRNLT